MKTVLALDLGGTKLRMALVTEQGDLLEATETPSASFESPQTMANEAASISSRLMAKVPGGVRPLGLAAAVAGVLDQPRGYLSASPNLPDWQGVPLKALLEQEMRLPCLLENDANAAALGEVHRGAGQGYSHVLYVTVSTGLGGGIVISGQLYRGSTGMAGEIGHILVEPGGPLCGCGNRGCLEAVASGTAIARYAAEELAKGASPSLAQRASLEGEGPTAEDVAQAARAGDTTAQDIVRRVATYLGQGLAGLVNVLNPQMVIIGGGVSQMGPMLLQPMEETLRARAFSAATKDLLVVPSALGDNAGLLGVADLLFTQLGKESAER